MKRTHLSLAIAALLAVGGLWLMRSAWHTHTSRKSNPNVGVKTLEGQPKPDPMLRPPDPIRRYRDLTPEQRVLLARQGPIGG